MYDITVNGLVSSTGLVFCTIRNIWSHYCKNVMIILLSIIFIFYILLTVITCPLFIYFPYKLLILILISGLAPTHNHEPHFFLLSSRILSFDLCTKSPNISYKIWDSNYHLCYSSYYLYDRRYSLIIIIISQVLTL